MALTSPKAALIVANSILPADAILQDCQQQVGLILCADGGANRARERDIVPDYVVGDLDSVWPETRDAFSTAEFVYRPSQYATDLEKTMQFALELGVERALVVGITGLRLDHQVCNLNIAQKFCHQLDLELHDDYGIGRFLSPGRDYSFEVPLNRPISLFAFQRVRGVTTSGLKYALANDDLEWAVRDGLSNAVEQSPISIRLKEGVLFMYEVRS